MASKNRCRICRKTFQTSYALKQHIKRKHPRYYYGLRAGVLAAVILLVVLSGFAYLTFFPHASTVTTSTTGSFKTFTSAATQGKSAPDFALPEISSSGLTGKTIGLSDFWDRPVFLEFMSPLCGHCEKMTPVIRDLEEKYGKRVVFISIMLGNASDDVSRKIASAIISEYGLNWIHLMDSDMSVFREYGVRGTPTYVILNRDHVEVARLVGSETSEKALEEALLRALQT